MNNQQPTKETDAKQEPRPFPLEEAEFGLWSALGRRFHITKVGAKYRYQQGDRRMVLAAIQINNRLREKRERNTIKIPEGRAA